MYESDFPRMDSQVMAFLINTADTFIFEKGGLFVPSHLNMQALKSLMSILRGSYSMCFKGAFFRHAHQLCRHLLQMHDSGSDMQDCRYICRPAFLWQACLENSG